MSHLVTLIPGDGIGPEVSAAAVRILEASGVEIRWDECEAGADFMMKHGTPLPEHVLNSARYTGVALKGPLTTPIGGGYTSPNVALRKNLELYACLRPVRTLPGIKTRYEDVDLVVIRENTEGLYSGLEHLVHPGVVESLKVVTDHASLRVSRYAFEYARSRGRKKITAVHKANIMKMSDGLFLECSRQIAKEYLEIEYEELIVDATCMKLVLDPTRFDMLLMENLYGDILSDLCAGLVGGLGLVPGANIGEVCAVFEAVHGSAPDIAGQGIANPIALTRSACLMLEHLGEPDAAAAIEAAIDRVLRAGKVRTPDLGGTSSTTELTDAIIAEMG